MTDETEKRETMLVLCAHPNGLQLRLYKAHDGLQDFETVQLNGGANQVDAAFMRAWAEENPGNDLVKNKTIDVVEPPAELPEGNPGEDNIVERPEHEAEVGVASHDDELDHERNSAAADGGAAQQQ